MSVRSLGYLRFASDRSLEEWRRFATDVLGAAASVGDGVLRLRLDERNFRIEVHESSASGLSAVGLDVGDERTLAELEDTLARAGTDVRTGSDEECARLGVLGLRHCIDPSGTPLELFYGQMYVKEPFVSPRGVRFVTGELGLGHVLIRASRYEESLRFYRDVLGFRVTDIWSSESVTAAFMRCNPRHHSVALRKADSESGYSLGHFMLEVDDLDAVGMAQERGGGFLTRTLGRHFNDEMLSCYFRTPSGFDVEYGTGGRRIDDQTWMTGQIDAPSGWGHKPVDR